MFIDEARVGDEVRILRRHPRDFGKCGAVISVSRTGRDGALEDLVGVRLPDDGGPTRTVWYSASELALIASPVKAT